MNKRSVFYLIFVILFSFRVSAQWSTNSAVNNVIASQTYWQIIPQITSDGKGGAIITWQDDRSGKYDIYAQRIDNSGYLKWNINGVLLCSDTSNQNVPSIVSDGFGGAIIVWTDNRVTNSDIYAQRIDSSGNVLWNSNGIMVCNANSYQNSPKIISDNLGGAIIAWQDNRTSPLGTIYVQRLNSSGTSIWTNNGLAVSTSTNGQSLPGLVTDRKKGAIITWTEFGTSNNDVYVQRIDSNGTVMWNSNGIAITNSVGFINRADHSIVEDGSGGAILTWSDTRSGTNFDIYAQKINSNGLIQWLNNGIPICTNGFDQAVPNIITDGIGGAIVAWKDGRAGFDIYAQHVNSSGAIQWAMNGISISNSSTIIDDYPQLISDGTGGAIISWVTSTPPYDLLAQRVNSNGNLQWNSGSPSSVSTAPNIQIDHQMVSDNNGGAILTWNDERVVGDYDVYAQKIFFNGTFNSVQEVLLGNEFKLYPNPTSNRINIASEINISKILVLNVVGTVIAEYYPKSKKYEFSLENFSEGLYYFKLITEVGNSTKLVSLMK